MDAVETKSPGVSVQRVIFPERLDLAPLYFHERGVTARNRPPVIQGRTSLVLHQGTVITTHTFFNAFYEAYWYEHTWVRDMCLRCRVSGEGTITVRRVPLDGHPSIVARADFSGALETVDLQIPTAHVHGRELGMLYFEVTARSERVILHQADWMALDVTPQPTRIAAGYCTFNRESFLFDNLQRILGDPSLTPYVATVIVADQGTRKVRDYPGVAELSAAEGDRLRIVEQANLGGSGGFGRCMIEALKTEGATHVLLMDDDAVLEPESIRRAAMFLSLAKSDVAVGGAMLSLVSPTEVHELGAYVSPEAIGTYSLIRGLPLQRPRSLETLREIRRPHYNGWWFFAASLSAVRKAGLPIPMFIKWDDVEYGCRLASLGVPTVNLPGVATWHMPFFLKSRGWDGYYAMRNGLICTALHFSQTSGIQLAKTLMRGLMFSLLKMDYYHAWQDVEGADDFCRGPQALAEEDTPARMREVVAKGRELQVEYLPKSACIPMGGIPKRHPWRLRRRVSLVWGVLRQFILPSPLPDAPPKCVMPQEAEHWYDLRRKDVVAIDETYNDKYAVLRRNRPLFLQLFFRGVWASAKLICLHGPLVRQWKEGMNSFTNEQFWNHYVGLEEEAAVPEPTASANVTRDSLAA